VESWINELRSRCGPLTDAATIFAAQLGVERDPPRGVNGLLALSRAVAQLDDEDDERLFVELAGSFFAVVLCDALGRGQHVARAGKHRVDLGAASFDPFGALERVLAADDTARALAQEVSRAEAEAAGTGPVARVAREVERQVRARWKRTHVVDRFDYTLKLEVDGDEVELDLSRLVRATHGETLANMQRAVEKFLAALPGLSTPASAWNEARESVLPRPLGAQMLAGLPEQSALSLLPLVASTKQAGAPKLGFVLRTERRARYVQAREVQSWDVSGAQLRAAAIENLAARSQNAKLVCTDTEHGPIVVAKSGDGLDAARVVLPGLIDVLGPELGVPFAVAIPHRDTLLACPLNAPAAVAHLRKTARDQAARAPHAISGDVMALGRDGELKVC
jgi:hypothetical protein